MATQLTHHKLDRRRDLPNRRDRGTTEALRHVSLQCHAIFAELCESPIAMLQYLHPYSNRNTRALLLEYFRATSQVRGNLNRSKDYLKLYLQLEVQRRSQEVAQNLRCHTSQ